MAAKDPLLTFCGQPAKEGAAIEYWRGIKLSAIMAHTITFRLIPSL